MTGSLGVGDCTASDGTYFDEIGAGTQEPQNCIDQNLLRG
jgi:hypothetical protein